MISCRDHNYYLKNQGIKLSEFADFGGHEKLSNALLTVQDILFDMEFNAPKKQSVIGDYFHPHV